MRDGSHQTSLARRSVHGLPSTADRRDGHDLAVVIPAWNEAANLEHLLPVLRQTLDDLALRADVVVVDGGSTDDTLSVAHRHGARLAAQREAGYGAALAAGFAGTVAPFVITMDADLSHRPVFLADFWRRRGEADVLIASRYVAGGSATVGQGRRVASRVLNRTFGHLLGLPQCDLSSGFRMYRREVLDDVAFRARDFDALQEILIRAVNRGFRVSEVPFHYHPRQYGRSHVRIVRFGWAYARTLLRMWRLRNSTAAPDYDWRAFDSPVWLQRYWQRARHRVVLGFVDDPSSVLDIGCGSSRIIADLPAAIGLDLAHTKLRWLRARHGRLVQGNALSLPCRSGAFRTVICSQVIEHLPNVPDLWDAIDRVLAPGGTLILGTPDYGRPLWHVIERVYGALLPGAYAGEHITRYTRRTLVDRLSTLGYEVLKVRYVGACELIVKARKPVTGGTAGSGLPLARG
ncbi:MAG: glycosyltransferase [Acidobacteriota bacterium]